MIETTAVVDVTNVTTATTARNEATEMIAPTEAIAMTATTMIAMTATSREVQLVVVHASTKETATTGCQIWNAHEETSAVFYISRTNVERR
jgi:mannosyltransferase OCH1-like enzyme